MRAFVWLGLVALAGSCNRMEVSHRTRVETRVAAPHVADEGPPVDDVASLRTMLTDADGTRSGRVHRMQNGFLTIDPAEKDAPRERLRLMPTAPVLRGRTAVSTDQLRPGTEVRVFYKHALGPEPPEAIGVEILGADGR